MKDTPTCPECGVPGYITQEHSWMSDGSIVQARHDQHRMAFLETENLDPLYLGIGELIGLPIVPVLTNIFRRSVVAYMERLVPVEVREEIGRGSGDVSAAFELMFDVARVMGYGRGRLQDLRFQGDADDYAVIRFYDPCSRPIIAGSIAGTIQAFIGRSAALAVKELKEDDAIEVHVFRGDKRRRHGTMRFRVERSGPKEGDIDLRRCEGCGGPAALKRFAWNSDRGIIRGISTGRRMGMIGPSVLDSVMSQLQDELGASIPEVVIEAQRRFVRGGPYRMEEISTEEDMRNEFALRGLGEVKELSFNRRGALLRLANPSLHMVVVGLIQGLFELAFGIESKVEWERDKTGSLLVRVTPWR